MTDNLTLWNAVKEVPPDYLKEIRGGRLKGMSDIKPVWRMEAMTRQFGPCGIGWKYRIVKEWDKPGTDGQVHYFVRVNLYVRDKDNKWSDPIPAIGGSTLIAKEGEGLRSTDEAPKMALTDALSVAMKALGVGARVYMGEWKHGRYVEPDPPINAEQLMNIESLSQEVSADEKKFLKHFEIDEINALPSGRYEEAVGLLEEKRRRQNSGNHNRHSSGRP